MGIASSKSMWDQADYRRRDNAPALRSPFVALEPSVSSNLSPRLIGQSPRVREIRAQIEQVEASRASVLLLGESGTGKEVIARALHGSRGPRVFVPIDCGSLVGPLVESELFGHVKGAFTGANENKKGLIEMANGGTAFFDEIGDLPLDLQVKLLRLLQEREYRPVGSLQRHRVDIRVIAATHRDLSQEIERGAFRLDLFYRLNIIKIRVPPLRERKEDIPLLIAQFLSAKGDYTITPEAMDIMVRHDWPGNVRELQNAIERLIALSAGRLLMREHLPSTVITAGTTSTLLRNAATAAADAPTRSPNPDAHPIRPLHEVEKRAILETLEYHRGDRDATASVLGIGRTTLYRKLKEYASESFDANS